MALVPDEPEERIIQLKRTQFIVSKMVDKVEDDEYGGVMSGGGDMEAARQAFAESEITVHSEYPSRDVFGIHATGPLASRVGGKRSFSGVTSPMATGGDNFQPPELK